MLPCSEVKVRLSRITRSTSACRVTTQKPLRTSAAPAGCHRTESDRRSHQPHLGQVRHGVQVWVKQVDVVNRAGKDQGPHGKRRPAGAQGAPRRPGPAPRASAAWQSTLPATLRSCSAVRADIGSNSSRRPNPGDPIAAVHHRLRHRVAYRCSARPARHEPGSRMRSLWRSTSPPPSAGEGNGDLDHLRVRCSTRGAIAGGQSELTAFIRGLGDVV